MKERTVIYAEDEENIRELEKLLHRDNFPEYIREEFYSDATSLQNRLEEGVQPGTVIVTDNTMPGGKGIDLIGKYSQRLDYSDVRFILVSAEHPLKEEAFEKGAYAFLEKPFSMNHFVSAVKSALGIEGEITSS